MPGLGVENVGVGNPQGVQFATEQFESVSGGAEGSSADDLPKAGMSPRAADGLSMSVMASPSGVLDPKGGGLSTVVSSTGSSEEGGTEGLDRVSGLTALSKGHSVASKGHLMPPKEATLIGVDVPGAGGEHTPRTRAVLAVVSEAATLYAAVVGATDAANRTYCEHFIHLPDRSRFRDYYERVSHPICLADIRRQLPNYQTRTEVWRDFRVMFANARLYNMEGCQVYSDSTVLDQVLSQKSGELSFGPEPDLGTLPTEEHDVDEDGTSEAATQARALREHKYYERIERDNNRELEEERTRQALSRRVKSRDRQRSKARKLAEVEAEAFERKATLFQQGALPTAEFCRLAASARQAAGPDGTPRMPHPFAEAEKRQQRRRRLSREPAEGGDDADVSSVSGTEKDADDMGVVETGPPPQRGPGQAVVSFSIGGARVTRRQLADLPPEYVGTEEHSAVCRLCQPGVLLDAGSDDEEAACTAVPAMPKPSPKATPKPSPRSRGVRMSTGLAGLLSPSAASLPRRPSIVEQVHTPKVRLVGFGWASAVASQAPRQSPESVVTIEGGDGAERSSPEPAVAAQRMKQMTSVRSGVVPAVAVAPNPASQGLSIQIPSKLSRLDTESITRRAAEARVEEILANVNDPVVPVLLPKSKFSTDTIPARKSRADLPEGLIPLRAGVDDGYNPQVTKTFRHRYKEGLLSLSRTSAVQTPVLTTVTPRATSKGAERTPISSTVHRRLGDDVLAAFDFNAAAESTSSYVAFATKLMAALVGVEVKCGGSGPNSDEFKIGKINKAGKIDCLCGCNSAPYTASAFAFHAENKAHRPMLHICATVHNAPIGELIEELRSSEPAQLALASAKSQPGKSTTPSSKSKRAGKSGSAQKRKPSASTKAQVRAAVKAAVKTPSSKVSKTLVSGQETKKLGSTVAGKGTQNTGPKTPTALLPAGSFFRDGEGRIRVVDVQKPHFRGVHVVTRSSGLRYRSQIERKGVRMSLGTHDDPVDAALAYDDAAVSLFGDDAILNLPRAGFQAQAKGTRLGFVHGPPSGLADTEETTSPGRSSRSGRKDRKPKDDGGMKQGAGIVSGAVVGSAESTRAAAHSSPPCETAIGATPASATPLRAEKRSRAGRARKQPVISARIETGEYGWSGPPLTMGTDVDVRGQESTDKWWPSVVVCVVEGSRGYLKIHYRGWSAAYDETLSVESGRIAPAGTRVAWAERRLAVSKEGELPAVSHASLDVDLVEDVDNPSKRRHVDLPLGGPDGATGRDGFAVAASPADHLALLGGADDDHSLPFSDPTHPQEGSHLHMYMSHLPFGTHDPALESSLPSIGGSLGVSDVALHDGGGASLSPAPVTLSASLSSDDACAYCGRTGELVKCDEAVCMKEFHRACAPSVMGGMSEGRWRCSEHMAEASNLHSMDAHGMAELPFLDIGM